MKLSKNKIKFGIGLFLFCCGYWVLDSVWSYLSFEKNLETMIFREPMSYLDTLLLDVPPYQVVSRIMVTAIFTVTGILIALFFSKRKKVEKENIQLERQLQQSQKMESIGTLAGGIAHDFNNILYGIIGFTELCLDDASPGTLLHENLKEILTGGKRAKGLVEQILMFSRQTERELQPIHVSTIVKEVFKLLRSTIPSTIHIDLDIQTENCTINGDPTQIHQVLMNLSTNAQHAMEAGGGTLKITLSSVMKAASPQKGKPAKPAPAAYLKLSVSDTGAGIPPEYRERIFDPFFTSKEQGKGTGMGLAVVHGIVNRHKGHIEVTSSLKNGTTFDIYFPMIADSEIRTDITPHSELPGGHEHIFLVDDEVHVIRLQKQILERLNYTVTTRTSSLQAIEAFKANYAKYDALITDMTMPNMTGDLLAAEVKKIKPDIPVILCSGYSDKIKNIKAAEIGVDILLKKPVANADLAIALRQVLDS